MASPLVQFRAREGTEQQIISRVAAHLLHDEDERNKLYTATVQRDINRYYSGIQAALFALHLSYKEAMLIVDALNGYLLTAEVPQLVAHNLRDAMIMDELDVKWDVNREEFLECLRHLSPLDCLALGDAAERWWNRSLVAETYEERCLAVGLIMSPRRPTLSPQEGEEHDSTPH